jgi:hypothetical protein
MLNSESNQSIKLKSSIIWEAIEEDLTRVLKGKISPNFINSDYLNLPEISQKAAVFELLDDISIDINSHEVATLLPDYISLPNKIKAILSNKNYISREEEKEVRQAEDQKVIFKVRKKRSHIREVDLDLFQELLNTASFLTTSNPFFWEETLNKLHYLEEGPSVNDLVKISGQDIDETFVEENLLFSNLPPKHYNDTGFLFRKKVLSEITSDVSRGTPLITLYGEGGIGKTTIIREAVDQLIKNHSESFDLIWWHSSKLEEMEADGARRIKDNIQPLEMIIEDLKEECGVNLSTAKEEGISVLLVLDNLETDLTSNREATISFIRENLHNCQIIITTRVRLGEMEIPFQVLPFTKKESSSYLRKLAISSNFKPIIEATEETLGNWSDALNNSPLYLRWFFQNLQKGKEPNEVLKESKNLISYIFKTVYENLTPDAKKLLGTLRIANKPLNRFQTKFILDDWGDDRFNEARISLESSSLIRTRILGGSNSFTVSEQAKNFLVRERLLDADYEATSEKLKEMQSSSGRLRRNTLIKDLFHIDYFPKREDDSKDIIVDKLIQINRKTLRLLKKRKAGEVDSESDQIEIINEFEKLIQAGAEYAPLYRLYGHHLFSQEDYQNAIEKYHIGLTLCQNKEERYQIEYLLAGAHQRVRNDEGLEIARNLWNEYKDPRTSYLLSAHLSDLGKLDESIKIAQEGISIAEKLETTSEKDLRRAIGRYLRTVSYAFMDSMTGTRDRLKIADEFFLYLGERLNFTYIDSKTIEHLSRLINNYILLISTINKTDGKTTPDGLFILFKEKEFLFEEKFKEQIYNTIRNNILNGADDFLKKLYIPIRKNSTFIRKSNDKDIFIVDSSRVIKIESKGGFGFVEYEEPQNLYFNRRSLSESDLSFNDLYEGMEVKFKAEKFVRNGETVWEITSLSEPNLENS